MLRIGASGGIEIQGDGPGLRAVGAQQFIADVLRIPRQVGDAAVADHLVRDVDRLQRIVHPLKEVGGANEFMFDSEIVEIDKQGVPLAG